MIKVFLPFSKDPHCTNKDWYLENGVESPENRSFIYLHPYYFHLNIEIYGWLIDQNIVHKIGSDIDGDTEMFYFIIFENKDDAMLFKLTWGGK
jgi:hypothetical protein